jgi:hypothetical protein
MTPDIQRIILLSTLGYTAYIIAVCPCKNMGYCKKEQFLVLSTIPLAFALSNYMTGASCSTE